MRKVLQIANDYFGTKLYQSLFDSLATQDIENRMFVPLAQNAPFPAYVPDHVAAVPCYRPLDRLLFFTKQKHMLNAILQRWDISTIDLIHAHTVFSGGYTAWKLHQEYHIPYIVAVRNTDVNVFFRYMVHLRHVGVKILRDAAAVIFLSPAYQSSVLETYVPKKYREEIRSKSLVIPNGISDVFVKDQHRPHPLPEQGVRLVYIGELSDNKNLPVTLSAVEQLRKDGIPATLTVAGPIRERKYDGFFKPYPFVTYLGKIPPERVKEVMRQSDIFVMPSHTETFGLVYAEAMSQGLPVLYTRGQGFDGHFPDGAVGYAVDDRSPVDVAEKIRAVMEHYAGLAQNAYEGAARFSWDTIARRYEGLYQECARNMDIHAGEEG